MPIAYCSIACCTLHLPLLTRFAVLPPPPPVRVRSQPVEQLPDPVWRYPLHYIAYHSYSFNGFMQNEFKVSRGAARWAFALLTPGYCDGAGRLTARLHAYPFVFCRARTAGAAHPTLCTTLQSPAPCLARTCWRTGAWTRASTSGEAMCMRAHACLHARGKRACALTSRPASGPFPAGVSHPTCCRPCFPACSTLLLRAQRKCLTA